MSTLTATQLQQQYIAYFGRPGDPAGIKYWLSSSSGISSAREFADKIYAQEEYKTSTVGSKSTEEQINGLYVNLFGRQADAKGLLYWTNQVENGTLSLSNIAYDLIAAASAPVSGNETQAALDASSLANKVAAAEAYTTEVENSTSAILAYQPESSTPWKTGAAFESAVTYIASVDSSTAHTAAGITTTVASMTTGSSVSGSSFTLTTTANETTGGADNFTGTSGSDTFLANASNAFDVGDIVDGKGGIDTLTTRYNITAAKSVSAAVTNVEKVTIDVDDGDSGNAHALTFSVDGFTGLTDVIGINGETDATNQDSLTVTNIASGVAVGVTNGDADFDYTFTYSDTTSLTNTETLKLNKAKADSITIAGVETLNIEGTNTSSIDTLTTAAATKYVITSSGKTTLTDIADTVKTIDASASTGDVTVAGVGAVDHTITGGSGNDKVEMAATITAKDTIDLGAGTDTVSITGDHTTAFTGITGVETVEIKEANLANGQTREVSGKFIAGATTFIHNITPGADNASVVTTFSNLDSGDTIQVDKAGSDTGSNGVDIIGTLTTDTLADSLTLKLQGLDAVSATATDDKGISDITLDTIETLNIQSNNNSANTIVKSGVEVLNVAAATGINVTGAAELNISSIVNTTKLTSFDASALTGKLTVTGLDASKLVFKSASKDTVVTIAGLNNEDQLIGGAGTKDYVTATAISGLTATTGKLNIQDFEDVELNVSNTTTNTIDTSLMTGVSILSLSGASPGTQTITNVPTGLKISVGDDAAEMDGNTDIDISLADETGAADTLTVVINNEGGNATDADLLVSSTVENIVLEVEDADANAYHATVSMDKAKQSKVTLTGGNAAATLTLGSLADETTTVDASALVTALVFDAGTTSDAKALTITAGASLAASDFDLSPKNDTVTIASTGAVDVDVDGKAGTDVLNLTVKTGFIDTGEIDNVETINFTVEAGDDITIGANADEVNGIDDAKTVTLTGGNALSTFTVGVTGTDVITANTLTSFDASTFEGNIALVYDTDDFTSADVVKAGSLTTDTIDATYDTAATYTPATTGIDSITATLDSGSTGSETYTIDVANATGLTSLKLDSPVAITDLNVNNYVDTLTVQFGSAVGTALDDSTAVDIVLASSSGTADKVKVKFVDVEDDAADTFDLDIAGVETFDVELGNTGGEGYSVDLAGVTATTGSEVTMTVTKGVAGDAFQILNTSTTLTTIDASGADQGLEITDRASVAMTIKGNDDTDIIRMEHTSDVLDGGGGTADKLNVVKAAVLGGIKVDLSSTTDQITTFNGSANAAIQKGFEKVDLSGFTGQHGADVTANKNGGTIVTTGNDDVIVGGVAIDTITPGRGDDTIDITETTNTVDVINMTEADSSTIATTAPKAAAKTDSLSGDTLVWGNGIDVVTGFVGGASGDTVDTSVGDANLPATLTDYDDITAGADFVIYGTWTSSTNTFTTATAFNASSAADALVFVAVTADQMSDATNIFVLDDIGAALHADNLVNA
jgi:hypothetical protein